MQYDEVWKIYEEAGALLKGHFVLSSGRHSSRYLQSALVLMRPECAEVLGKALAEAIDPRDVDMVISPALGGLIIGHEVARALRRPFVFTERKEGAMQLRRGFEIPKDARLLLVEDVITTGGSVRECMRVAREQGGVITQILALVDRAPSARDRFDVPHRSLMELEVEDFAVADCPMCAEGLPAVKPGSRGAV